MEEEEEEEAAVFRVLTAVCVVAARSLALEQRMRPVDGIPRRQAIGDELHGGVSVPGGAGGGEACEREDEEEKPHRELGDKGILFV